MKKSINALAQIDELLIDIFAKREHLVTETTTDIEHLKELSKERNIDPDFIQALFYWNDSKSHIVSPKKLPIQKVPEKNKLLFLREQLLLLTEQIAVEYDEAYETKAPFSTRSIFEFEKEVIQAEISALQGCGNTDMATDLGCANGRMSFMVAGSFKKIVGYDISPAMIVACNGNKNRCNNIFEFENVTFEKADIGQKIPLENNSVSFVIMNLGTGSDIHNFKVCVREIKRVLKPDGRFVISFYNAGALFYEWLLPWNISLNAKIDQEQHCLSVHSHENIYQIYARPYTVREIRKLFEKINGLTISKVLTYPTMATILPDAFFTREKTETINAIDRRLSVMDKGAYILITGRKI